MTWGWGKCLCPETKPTPMVEGPPFHAFTEIGDARRGYRAFRNDDRMTYLQAVTMISTSTSGAAISACTQARAGAPSAGNHGVQTSFMAPRSLMSFTQIIACSRRVLSVP